MIDLNTVISTVKDQVSANLSDEVVILNLKTGIYFGLNPVGAFIWSLIQKPTSIRSVREKVLEEYDVDPERCDSELVDLIQQLCDASLIEVVNAADS